MSTQTQLVEGQVVETKTIELNVFVENKQREIKMLQEQIKFSTDRLEEVLNELAKLIQ